MDSTLSCTLQTFAYSKKISITDNTDNFEAMLHFSDCSARSIDFLSSTIHFSPPCFLLVKRTNQPVGRMTGERLLFPVTLMSVLSLLTLQMSHGEILAEESCTIQLLVPGLKGTLSYAL